MSRVRWMLLRVMSLYGLIPLTGTGIGRLLLGGTDRSVVSG